MHSFVTASILILAMMFPTPTLHNFSLADVDGKTTNLSDFEGKVALVVNVASMCGYTYHYEYLEQLYQKYKAKGFTVLAFPANDFGEQEPGTNQEIKQFCTATYGVSFPLFSKISVKGANKHPLYAWLTSGDGKKEFAGEIPWNFEKFLIDRNGHIIARFNYRTRPDDPAVVEAIEKALR